MIKIIKKLRHYTEISINEKVYNIENEVAYKYQLKEGKEVDANLLKKIIEDNNYYYFDRIAKNKMKNFLSVKEMKSFLLSKGASKELIDKLIGMYIEYNYLNDLDLIKSYISFNSRKEGPKLISAKLKQKGLSNDLIIQEVNAIDEERILKDLIKKELNKPANKNINQISNTVKAKFINKGYSQNLVFEIVDNNIGKLEIDELPLAKKEFEKLYRQYQTKKEGTELFYLIKTKLYTKGFSKDVIDEVLLEFKNN